MPTRRRWKELRSLRTTTKTGTDAVPVARWAPRVPDTCLPHPVITATPSTVDFQDVTATTPAFTTIQTHPLLRCRIVTTTVDRKTVSRKVRQGTTRPPSAPGVGVENNWCSQIRTWQLRCLRRATCCRVFQSKPSDCQEVLMAQKDSALELEPDFPLLQNELFLSYQVIRTLKNL